MLQLLERPENLGEKERNRQKIRKKGSHRNCFAEDQDEAIKIKRIKSRWIKIRKGIKDVDWGHCMLSRVEGGG
jgi:hypothetical protein